MRRLALAILLFCCLLSAQPRTEARATFGNTSFLDESALHHVTVGGSMRFYLTRRLSVEPEFLYLRESRRDQDYVVVPNIAFDFTRPDARVTPYVIGGAGLLRTRQLTGAGFYSANTGTWGAGVGAKVFLTQRLFFSPEVRFGVEPFFRATVSVGFVLSRGR